jgi:hypothetical protein
MRVIIHSLRLPMLDWLTMWPSFRNRKLSLKCEKESPVVGYINFILLWSQGQLIAWGCKLRYTAAPIGFAELQGISEWRHYNRVHFLGNNIACDPPICDLKTLAAIPAPITYLDLKLAGMALHK